MQGEFWASVLTTTADDAEGRAKSPPPHQTSPVHSEKRARAVKSALAAAAKPAGSLLILSARLANRPQLDPCFIKLKFLVLPRQTFFESVFNKFQSDAADKKRNN